MILIVRYFKDRVAPDVVEEMVLMGAYVNRHSLLLHTAAADGNTSQAALFLGQMLLWNMPTETGGRPSFTPVGTADRNA